MCVGDFFFFLIDSLSNIGKILPEQSASPVWMNE